MDASADDDERSPAVAPRWRRGRAATGFGRAVHAVLEAVPLDDDGAMADLARVAAATEGLADRAEEVAIVARSIWGSPTVRAASSAGDVHREMYVTAPVEGRVIEGYIDLLVRTADGVLIVDYKTDWIADAKGVDSRVEEYRLQLAAYALAVEAATGLTVAGGVLVFGAPTGALERRVERADLGLDEVRALLAAT